MNVSPQPPALPVLGYWADRGRPQTGLATLPAPPLCLRSNPGSWGRGESGGGGGAAVVVIKDEVLGTLCFGVSRPPDSVSLYLALEGWGSRN